MRYSLFYSLVLATAGLLAHAQDTCTAGGVSGTCISTGSCSSSGRKSTPGLCPGPTDIQCCTKRKSKCKATGVGTSCTISSGTSGTCKVTSSCSGTSTPGFCPGAANVQCCTESSGGSTGGSSSGGSLSSLDAKQSGYAQTIADAAHSYSLPIRGCEVAIATAMQESKIRVLANTGVPDSYNYPHDGEGSDHDSVGLFQQRPRFWCPGKTGDCMDPATSAGKFYAALKGVSGWESMSIAKAAQSVQKSAFPDAYAKWESLAKEVCAAAF